MRKLKNQAFTLIELMAVVMIAGILAAIVVPSISPSDDFRASAAARVMLSDITYAQAQALATQKKFYVVFEDSQYSIQSRASDGAALAVVTHPVTKQDFTCPFGSGHLNNVYLATAQFGTQSVLSFDESGTPMYWNSGTNTNTTLTTTGTIRIQSGSFYMTIKVAPYTGEISITEG